MASNLSPSISLFISRLTNADLDQVLYDLKKVSNKEDTPLNVCKRLYIFNMYGLGSPLDFLKACASSSLSTKLISYQGLLLCTPALVLLQNCILKDLQNPVIFSDVLGFLANLRDSDKILGEVVRRIPKPPERSKEYLKYLIVRSKYESRMWFGLISDTDTKLLVKLQIVQDRSFQIEERDLAWLKLRFPSIKCGYTRVKALQTLKQHISILDDAFIHHLRLIHPSTKSMKQIEVAQALEAIELLKATGRMSERVEEVVFRFLNSENTNSRFLGLKYGSKLKVIPDIVISRVFELWNVENPEHDTFYLNTLLKLIDHTNTKIVFEKLREFKNCRKERANQIIQKLCEFGDQELMCRILLEYPEHYRAVSSKNMLFKEQTSELFKAIFKQDNPEYFEMIYDLFPFKFRSNEDIAELGVKHLGVLQTNNLLSHERYISRLIDFLCLNGDPRLNRETLLKEIEEKGWSSEILFQEIRAFNLVLGNATTTPAKN